MRHGKKNNHLGRTDTHRKAMLSNMASSLILHKRINTTLAKAKALRVYVEPLLTKSKTDSTHNRRVVFSYLQNKDSVTVLFREVAEKISERQGGYTRIIKTGTRAGDNAEMCFIELVDYNALYNAKAEATKAKSTRRGSRRVAKATQLPGEPSTDHAKETTDSAVDATLPNSEANAKKGGDKDEKTLKVEAVTPEPKPEAPGTKPEIPGTEPEIPGTEPEIPRQPITKPEVPGTEPEMPGSPGTKPEIPGTDF